MSRRLNSYLLIDNTATVHPPRPQNPRERHLYCAAIAREVFELVSDAAKPMRLTISPADPIAIGETRVHRVSGGPAYRVDDHVPAGPFADQCGQSRGREIDIALQRRRALHLKQ
jgi:hypothetical protein